MKFKDSKMVVVHDCQEELWSFDESNQEIKETPHVALSKGDVVTCMTEPYFKNNLWVVMAMTTDRKFAEIKMQYLQYVKNKTINEENNA